MPRRLRLASWLPTRCFSDAATAANGDAPDPPKPPAPSPPATFTGISRPRTSPSPAPCLRHEEDPRTSASSCTVASIAKASICHGHDSRTSSGGSRSSSSGVIPGRAESDNSTATAAACSSGSSTAGYPEGERAALGKPSPVADTVVGAAAAEPGAEEALESELLLWRRFRLTQYLSAVSPSWRRVVGMFEYTVVARPSNDPSLGLQGWRRGLLDRWELKFPVLTIFDAPGRAAPGEGFTEWPLFDIFKLFRSFESEGHLTCQVVRLGPEAFAPRPQPQPPMPSHGTPEAAPAPAAPCKGICEAKACRPGATVFCEPLSVPAEALNNGASGFESDIWRFRLPQVPSPGQDDVAVQRLDDGLPQDQEPEQQQQQQQQQHSIGLPLPPLLEQGQTRSQRKKQRKQQKQAQEQQQQQQQDMALKHGKKRSDCAPGGGDATAAPPQLSFVTPGSVAEAEALLGQMWGLYEQTGTRNGFVECSREQFERLVREAPGVQAVVVREGGSASGPLLAFGLLLPQRESLQLLYIGMEYDNPLVRQSSCYFQILSVGLQVALVHNEAVRQRRAAAAAAVAAAAKACRGLLATAGPSVSASSTQQMSPAAPRPFAAATAAIATSTTTSSGGDGAISALADGTAAGVAAAASPPPPPPPPSLGPRVGLIEFLDLGPGRRFVKEHLGAVGHPVSMYTRGIGPIAQRMSRRLLARYFSPKVYVNDP
ncbi:hypothetical protein PLESTF_000826900 [Pleodorina starrii]|nr:hypothetical protein PLESTF_000826900 [Pleodorina starrii]